MIDGRPVDMLQDFYIPALRLAVRYARVAGYFRSSSLAAASREFSALAGRRGKMHLYVRLLRRLAEANMIVGMQQILLLPVEPEEFRRLAEGELTPDELEARAREKIVKQCKQTESMEIPRKSFMKSTYACPGTVTGGPLR